MQAHHVCMSSSHGTGKKVRRLSIEPCHSSLDDDCCACKYSDPSLVCYLYSDLSASGITLFDLTRALAAAEGSATRILHCLFVVSTNLARSSLQLHAPLKEKKSPLCVLHVGRFACVVWRLATK